MFLIPERISCSGTQVTINAEGFCTLSRKTESHSAEFRLLVFEHINDEYIKVDDTTVNVNCENIDGRRHYSEGNVNRQSASLNICSGCYLAVRFKSKCNNNNLVCPFQPTSVNSSNRHVLHFQNISRGANQLKPEDGEMRNISFLFSAKIIENGMNLKI